MRKEHWANGMVGKLENTVGSTRSGDVGRDGFNVVMVAREGGGASKGYR